MVMEKTPAKQSNEIKPIGFQQTWMARWPEALRLWGMFLRLPEPLFCGSPEQEAEQGLTESFAAIRLTDHRIILSPRTIGELGLQGLPLEILGHEIGHHVLCPADLSDMGRMLARMRRMLPTVEPMAPMVGNLYTDLLINDRLFRQQGLKMDSIYRALENDGADPLWRFYMRIYEILWGLGKGTLARGEITSEMEGDAQLGNRVIRNFAGDWVRGSGRFAALCLPYLLESMKQRKQVYLRLLDASRLGPGEELPGGLAEIDPDEIADSVHPAEEGDGKGPPKDGTGRPGNSGGNYREPFEYGELLKAMGINLTEAEMASRYYRERAIPHLVPFPTREVKHRTEPMPEGFDVWGVGDPLDRVNWLESAMRSPVIIPGVTALETRYGSDSGFEKEREPVDLDLYIDSSGSMPNPRVQLSFLALAGAIISLSALRAGSRVQATLWSGARQFKTTRGFTDDEKSILAVITDFIGGCTAFPLHILRDTYQDRPPSARRVHILHISDEGIDTIYAKDERGGRGADIAAMALERAGGGGSMVLNLWQKDWRQNKHLAFAEQQGWMIYPVKTWEDLLAFARDFVRRQYTTTK